MRPLVLFLVAVAGWVLAPGAQAQPTWPTKPIRVIVPYPAGGVVDVMARIITHRLGPELGQSIVVDARPGANANIATEAVARSAPDGHTLLVTAPFLINNPVLESDLRWQPKDFVPVARFALSPSFLVVRNDVPSRSVQELIEHLRAKPGQAVADGGGGSTQSMSLYMLQSVARLDLLQVNYKGAPQQMAAIVNGEAVFAILPSSVTLTASRTGKLKVLANTSAARSALFPDVPTMAESGFPETTVMSWYGFHVPAGTPIDVIRRLSEAIGVAASTDEAKTRTAGAGGEIAWLGTPAFEAFLREDALRWSRFHQVIRRK